jgi:tetratricopeptide (TPR) repeat protein
MMTVEPTVNPFPGLRPFEADEEHLFFGREGQSEEILRRLRRHRFLAVVGSSGSGKSSLIRAGLLPYLYGGFLADGNSHWRVAIFRPGANPIGNLAAALNYPSVLGNPPRGVQAAREDSMLLEVSLRRSGVGLIEVIRLARLPERDQVLVVIDQFEELFRFANTTDKSGRDEDAAAFVKLLLEASSQRDLPIYVVLTMRSDFIGDCARYRDLPEAVTGGLYLIPRMTREQRRAAIVEPVRVGGGTIAPRLAVRLLNDVSDDPDQLPILQHALMRTWDYWTAHRGEGRPIALDDYLEIGRMSGALSQHADEAYDGLPNDRFRAIARRMFQALTEKGVDNREARRPTTVAMLADAADAPASDIIRIVEDFRRPGRSFLMPPAPVVLGPGSVIDISHESLIRGWRRLRQWVEEEAESAKIYGRLAETAALHKLGTAGLWHDPDLAHALTWHDQENPNRAWAARYNPNFTQAMAFLEKSRNARETEQRQKEAARWRALAASLVAAAVLGIVAIVAVVNWLSAQQALRIADSERDRAQQALGAADAERDRAQQALKAAAAERDRAEEARTAADRAHDGAQQAYDTTTHLAYTLVFEMGQDPRLRGIDDDLVGRMYDRAIASYDQVIRINPTAHAYNGRGVAYFGKKYFDLAIADYDQAIQLDSKFLAAYNNRGHAYSAKKDYDQAISDYGQAIQINSNSASAYIGRGDAYFAKKDYDRAIADYDQALRINPKSTSAYIGRGNAYQDKGDLNRAIADYDQAIQLDPKSAAYTSRRSALSDDKNGSDIEGDRAIAEYGQEIQLERKYVSAYKARGDAYFRKKDYDGAIANYDQAIQLDPKSSVAYHQRGSAYREKNDYDRAIAEYDQAIQLDPEYVLAYNSRGIAYRLKKDYDRAIASYDQAIQLDPKYLPPYNNRGYAYRLKGDLDRAIASYNQAIQLDPKYAIAHNNRGYAYRLKGDLDRAIADYDRAIQLDPEYAIAHDNRRAAYQDILRRGRAYYEKKDYDRAIADYGLALHIDPKSTSAYIGRGNAYRDKGDLDRAIADYDQAIQLDPKYFRGYHSRGAAYFAKKEYGRAIADYDEAISLAPNEIRIYASRAHALMFLERLDEARSLYLQYRGRQNVADGKPWEKLILADFIDFRKTGLSHPLMNKIEGLLSGPRSSRLR